MRRSRHLHEEKHYPRRRPVKRIFAEEVIEEVYDVPARRSGKEICSSSAVGLRVSAPGYAYSETPRGLFMLMKMYFLDPVNVILVHIPDGYLDPISAGVT
jgi:hypothetical protein